MNVIMEELKSRELPQLMCLNNGQMVLSSDNWQVRREEIGEVINRELAGYPPRFSYRTSYEVIRKEQNSFGGKAITEYWEVQVRSDFSSAVFPFTLTIPTGRKQVPLFIYLAFSPIPADGIGEEIIDEGYAVASVYYQDITADYFDGHTTGLGRFCTRNSFDSWGKLRIWAWASQRILDVLEGDLRVDKKQIAIMGHSRLGKTALLAGAFDTRYSLTISCQSGAGGAALFRGKSGEAIENLYGQGSRLWFDGNFFQYKDNIEKLPFDQHFLLAMVAPRHLYVSSAARDDWADPKSEFLSCVAASQVYECYGMNGLCSKDNFPKEGEYFHEGQIGYHLRAGTHYLSRDDWRLIISYRKKHKV